MNLNNIEVFNLGDFEQIPGFGEYGMVRIPSRVRNHLNERARFVGMDSVGIEIRFVTDAPNIDLYISVQKHEQFERGIVRVFKGNFQYKVLEIEPGNTNFFRINPPPAYTIENENMINQGGFSSNVWRIVCDRGTVVFQGINTHGHTIRPPEKKELPSINWLAYGSSITNSHLDGYIYFAATKLRMQVQNKGFGGACHIEKELVDYFIDECKFDIITCELGINMRGQYTPEEFEKRASYLIERLIKLKKPALIITTFPNSLSEGYSSKMHTLTETEIAYNNILIKLVEEAQCKTLQLVHGYEILDDIHGLSSDLLHPSVYGHAIMGMNLAKRLKLFLNI